jgi:hypothetical protein
MLGYWPAHGQRRLAGERVAGAVGLRMAYFAPFFGDFSLP